MPKAAPLPSMAGLIFKSYFYNIVPKRVWFVTEMYFANDTCVLKCERRAWLTAQWGSQQLFWETPCTTCTGIGAYCAQQVQSSLLLLISGLKKKCTWGGRALAFITLTWWRNCSESLTPVGGAPVLCSLVFSRHKSCCVFPEGHLQGCTSFMDGLSHARVLL